MLPMLAGTSVVHPYLGNGKTHRAEEQWLSAEEKEEEEEEGEDKGSSPGLREDIFNTTTDTVDEFVCLNSARSPGLTRSKAIKSHKTLNFCIYQKMSRRMKERRL